MPYLLIQWWWHRPMQMAHSHQTRSAGSNSCSTGHAHSSPPSSWWCPVMTSTACWYVEGRTLSRTLLNHVRSANAGALERTKPAQNVMHCTKYWSLMHDRWRWVLLMMGTVDAAANKDRFCAFHLNEWSFKLFAELWRGADQSIASPVAAQQCLHPINVWPCQPPAGCTDETRWRLQRTKAVRLLVTKLFALINSQKCIEMNCLASITIDNKA